MTDTKSKIAKQRASLLKRPQYYDYSLKKPFFSHKTMDELLAQGYVAIDYNLSSDNAFAAAAHKFKDKIEWSVTKLDAKEVWLMTPHKEALKQLAQFMLSKFSWCPMVYAEKPKAAFIFTPKSEIEKAAIEATISGEYGWQGSLYSLELFEYQENTVGFIFTTKPLDSPKQEWLLVQLNFKNYTGSWSHHDGSLEQTYYIWKEQIQLEEPNYKPTSDEILDALQD